MTTIQEDVHYDGGPAKGDLIFNLLLGITLIGLPFTIGAVVRALWLRFRITSRRISVTGGWMGKDKTQVVYSQIKEVRTVPRGFGAWETWCLFSPMGLAWNCVRCRASGMSRPTSSSAFNSGSTPAEKPVEGFAV